MGKSCPLYFVSIGLVAQMLMQGLLQGHVHLGLC